MGENELTVFPNPSNGHLTVNLPASKNEPALLTLLNGQGVAVYKQTATNKGPHTMEVTNQPAGLYMLRVSSGTKQWTKKILINH